MSKQARRLARTVTTSVAVVLLMPAIAWAHARLTRSEPRAGARLPAPPAIRLWFSEAPEFALTRVILRDSAGRVVELGRIERDSTKLAVKFRIAHTLEAGEYTVVWRAAAADGHPSEGTFTFVVLPSRTPDSTATVGRAAPRESASTGSKPVQASPGTGALSVTYVGVRAMLFSALLTLIGTVAFRFTILPRTATLNEKARLSMRARAAGLGMWAAAALLVSNVARLQLQSSLMQMPSMPGMLMPGESTVGALITATQWGLVWIGQCTGALIALLALAGARRGHASGWSIAAIVSVVLAFTPALSGHASALPRMAALAVTADGIHVLGAAGWLGSLLCIVVLVMPGGLREPREARWATIASMVNAFSPMALIFAACVAITGVLNAWLQLSSVPALWTSGYGRTLLVKLGVLTALAATGAFNWLRVRPALGTEVATARVRRSASVELAISVLVIVVTAILVATPTPGSTG